MKLIPIKWLLLLACSFTPALVAENAAPSSSSEFGAYYTSLETGQPWEAYSRTGETADVVVDVGRAGGQLVFWRGNSYLPYWKTAKGQWNLSEIIPRSGDGPQSMPDRNNVYSHVQIIKNTDDSVVVHWRYLPNFSGGNPHGNVKSDHFVDEVFTITPDGQVTRTIKKGTEKFDDWLDPLNQYTEILQLGMEGVVEKSLTQPKLTVTSSSGKAEEGSEKGSNGPKPSLWFKFNEGTGEKTKESETGAELPILGPKVLWKNGISGSALQFDGYNTVVSLPAAKAPGLSSGSLTVEGWFALGAYPWNWAPIVQQEDGGGYFLGVDGHGYPGFRVKVHGVWEQLTVPNSPPYKDANHLDLFRWYHMAGTYNRQDGKMQLYVNGKLVAEKTISNDGVQISNADVRIGKSTVPSVPVDGGGPTEFGFDGLIDEVKIYDVALSGEQISAPVLEAGLIMGKAPDMQKRSLPNPETDGKFKAAYTHLNYYETWDNLWRVGADSDVVVSFDQLPTKFVFWRGVSYIPMLVNESNQWLTQEFNERLGNSLSLALGDCEPMSDKACNDSHVRIIENNAARVVVEWRYRLANPTLAWAYYNDKTGWGDIADWYYYIYPDGVASKLMRCYSSRPDLFLEWDEQIAILGEGQHPEEVINKTPVMTLVDEAGKATDYDWNPKPPRVNFNDQIIQKINFKGKYSPFAIQKFNGGDIYAPSKDSFYSVFPAWNHWPTSQINSSCRNASFPDRAAHSSFSHLALPFYSKHEGSIPYEEKVLMEGMTDQPGASLVNLAKSWLSAPLLETISDCRSLGYDQAQRAYVLSATGPSPSFRIVASAEHPIANLCFVVKNWNCKDLAQLQIDSKDEPAGPAFRQGIERDANGRRFLVVWLQRKGTEPVTFTLHGAKPELSAPKSVTWAKVPEAVTNTLNVTMAATLLPGIGNQYLFERVGGGEGSASWQKFPVYTDRDLPPNTEVAYRVKACDAYFAETEWSPVAKVKTPTPAPVIWNFEEGEGKTIKDSAGQHTGTISGEASWVPGVAGKALHFDGKSYVELSPADDLHSNGNFTWMAWIRTTEGGTILARAGAGSHYSPGGKALFVENGRLNVDIGWVGRVGAEAPVADGKWHHVGVVSNHDKVQCFVDGVLSGSAPLKVPGHEEKGLPIRIGFCNDDFPKPQSGFVGDIDGVQWYGYALSPDAVSQIYRKSEK